EAHSGAIAGRADLLQHHPSAACADDRCTGTGRDRRRGQHGARPFRIDPFGDAAARPHGLPDAQRPPDQARTADLRALHRAGAHESLDQPGRSALRRRRADRARPPQTHRAERAALAGRTARSEADRSARGDAEASRGRADGRWPSNGGTAVRVRTVRLDAVLAPPIRSEQRERLAPRPDQGGLHRSGLGSDIRRPPRDRRPASRFGLRHCRCVLQRSPPGLESEHKKHPGLDHEDAGQGRQHAGQSLPGEDRDHDVLDQRGRDPSGGGADRRAAKPIARREQFRDVHREPGRQHDIDRGDEQEAHGCERNTVRHMRIG
ncbi:hypothetical protein chiPu_0028502, partial [Chiloscyllium punctatum]|nr:hypothetical protein [Chiloscyllium punctatum]